MTSKPDFKVIVLLLVFMQLTRDLFAIAKFLFVYVIIHVHRVVLVINNASCRPFGRLLSDIGLKKKRLGDSATGCESSLEHAVTFTREKTENLMPKRRALFATSSG